MRSLLSACIVAGLVAATSLAEVSPDFSLKNLSDSTVTLSALKGKIVVIDFWAMWCAACREAFPNLSALTKEFTGKNVVVLGINLEKAKREKVAAFVKKAGIAYEVLLDPEGTTAAAFGIKGVPSLVIVNADGSIAKTFRGMNKATEKEIKGLLSSLTSTSK
jgi:cytochrome c biogenesis protein CcmG/thiol:disulfide interchange protein DsbE